MRTPEDLAYREGLKDAIVHYAKNRDGAIKASEISWDLGLPPEVVNELCRELLSEGSLSTKSRDDT